MWQKHYSHEVPHRLDFGAGQRVDVVVKRASFVIVVSLAASTAASVGADRAAAQAIAPGLQDRVNNLALKAPPLAVPPAYSWTGFYLGANIGYSVGNDRATQAFTNIINGITAVPTAAFVTVPSGVIGGVQAGYNWQVGSNWLVGFETDFQGSGQQDTACILTCFTENVPTQPETATIQHRLDYFGTARARVGMVSNNALFYVTGGGAYGRVTQTATTAISDVIPSTGPGTITTNSISENKFGWVVGGGIEAALWGHWTGKVEYLYMDLGTITNSMTGLFSPNAFGFSATTSSTIKDNIVRAGVNYRFGAEHAVAVYDRVGPPPIFAGAPLYNWTGFYAGANIGYGSGNDRLAQTIVETGARSVAISSTADSAIAPNGILGGVQFGYNWQGGRNWLVGVEADFQGSAQNDKACTPILCFTEAAANNNPALSETDSITIEQHLDYFGTLRGRVGVVNDNILFYGTGGVALGHVTDNVSLATAFFGLPPAFASSSSSADLTGWVAGGGIEAALWGRWTGKLEYLYMDLGGISNTLTAAVPGIGTEVVTTTSTVRDNIFRAGINYRF